MPAWIAAHPWLTAAGILVCAIGGAALFVAFGAVRATRAAVRDLGRPTPESARVVYEAGRKEETNAQQKANDWQNASPDALRRRRDELRARGRSGK